MTDLTERARRAVLRQLAEAHDHFSEAEQLARGGGRDIEADGFHAYALMTLRAYRAELDEPRRKVTA